MCKVHEQKRSRPSDKRSRSSKIGYMPSDGRYRGKILQPRMKKVAMRLIMKAAKGIRREIKDLRR